MMDKTRSPVDSAAGSGVHACGCGARRHTSRLVVVTGGPGAGKTAVLELAKRGLCKHVRVLPEAATMIFGGGFPRDDNDDVRRCAQRAIFHVQRELETAVTVTGKDAVALCDRGTLDGLAYWPGEAAEFYERLSTTRALELARYYAVIHLRVPPAVHYNHDNVVRLEDAARARALDAKILEIWSAHPNRHVIESAEDFLDKAKVALAVIERELPSCCSHASDTVAAAS